MNHIAYCVVSDVVDGEYTQLTRIFKIDSDWKTDPDGEAYINDMIKQNMAEACAFDFYHKQGGSLWKWPLFFDIYEGCKTGNTFTCKIESEFEPIFNAVIKETHN
jgi:hypothetical protein